MSASDSHDLPVMRSMLRKWTTGQQHGERKHMERQSGTLYQPAGVGGRG